MARKDYYYNKSKQEGYRSRAAYKLMQLDDAESLIQPGDSVLDIGAAPGGWLQVAAERSGEAGPVIGVDLQAISPLEDVETIQGDITSEAFIKELTDMLGGTEVDVVLSDMAPNVTGEYGLDQARSVHLARAAFDVACRVLAPGGNLVVKVFDGPDVEELRSAMTKEFDYVTRTRPDASRDESSESYLIGKHRLTSPVRPGDTLDVDIVDIGNEGDGIARIEGFTVFVPDTNIGDRVSVRIVDVKPRFGFAERID